MTNEDILSPDGPVDVSVGQGEDDEVSPLRGQFKLPDAIPLLPVRDMSMFPRMVLPMVVGENRHMQLIDDAVSGDKVIGLVAIKGEVKPDQIGPSDIHEIGVAALILKMAKGEREGVRLIAQGLTRFRVVHVLQVEPYMKALVRPVADVAGDDLETMALVNNLKTQFRRVLQLAPHLPEELHALIGSVEDPGALCDMVASAMNLSPEERQSVVEALAVKERLLKVTSLLNREIQMLELGSKIQKQVKDGLEKTQKDYYLRQQMKAIQKELGEEEEAGDSEVDELRDKLRAKALPDQVRAEAERELKRMSRMHASSSEYHVIHTYLDWILNRPGARRPRTSSTSPRPARYWRQTTTTWTRSSGASWNTWPCASSTRP